METSYDNRRFDAAGAGVLLAVLVCWIALSLKAVPWQGTWPDETAYILKSWWYIDGTVKPYTAEDATWYQPLFFYALGVWQWIFGHGVVSARSLSVVVTAINIGLLAGLLQRLGCTVWPIALATVVFVLNEDSIFYFNSASPFAGFICLQLVALHLLLRMKKSASFAIAMALGAVLTMTYLFRINSVAFIALCLGIVWVRAGRDRWRVYACSAAIVALTWSLLALLWGRQFAYVTLWLPGVTDWLTQVGALPKLYPHAMRLSHKVLDDVMSHPTLWHLLAYAFGWDVLGHYVLNHHAVPIASAVFAMIVAALRPIPNRGWTGLFAASYWALLVFYHLGLQSMCGGCIQAYANFANYLAALAGGLALHGLMVTSRSKLAARSMAAGMVVTLIALAAEQAWSLTGNYQLPSIRNRTDPLPAEVKVAGATMKTLLPRGTVAGIVGVDPRIPLALQVADVRVPPVFLTLPSTYRKLNEGLTPEQHATTIAELADLSGWTDEIAKQWIENDFDWLVVQRLPAPPALPWLIWAPDAPLITTALEKCFERGAAPDFADFDPPLSVELYKRVRRGKVCLGE
jgi:hypothetical protein